MGDTRIQNGFGDAALAEKVVDEYADGVDALTKDECAALEIGAQQCEMLRQALGKGKEGIVTDDERMRLETAGFAMEFVEHLVGDDGTGALQRRVAWLGEHCTLKPGLAGSSVYDRKQIIKELGEIGPAAASAVPVLIDALKDGDSDVRADAAEALGMIGLQSIAAIRNLEEALSDEDVTVCQMAGLAIGQIDPVGEHVAPLFNALVKHRFYDRFIGDRCTDAIIGALREIGQASIPFLVDRLEKGNDQKIRMAAVKMLGNIGPAAAPAIPTLIGALKDRDSDVRERAAWALGWIVSSTAPPVPALIPALTETLKDSDRHVRESAAWTLGKIGPPAVPALIEALKDRDIEVRMTAALGLGKIGQPAVPALIKVLKDRKGEVLDEWEVLNAATEALGEIGPPAVPALIKALKDKRWNVRANSAWALAKIGPAAAPATHDLTEVLLKDKNCDVRESAAWALGKIGPAAKPAISSLINALKDGDSDVRVGAAEALGMIGPASAPAVPRLIEMLGSEMLGSKNAVICSAVTKALGGIGGAARHAIPILEKMRDAHPDIRCRHAAGEAVEKIAGD